MQEARKKVILLGYVSLVLCVLAVTASFAWMSISSTPTVTDLALSVVSDNKLEIAPNNEGTPGAWGSILDLSEFSELQAPLKPVTFSSEDNSFYAPNYGIDGRADFSNPTRITDSDGKVLLSEDTSIYSYSFWLRTTSSACQVGLTEAVEREDGNLGGGTYVVGEPVWNEQKICHEQGGNGSEKAVRMAIHVQEGNGEGQWIIYEPYAEEEKVTKSISGESYEGNNRLIRQNASNWTESTPVLKDSVIYKSGEFLDNTKGLFGLEPGISKLVTVYLWIEGQDPDCNNTISGGRILANLQFSGDLNEENNIRPE